MSLKTSKTILKVFGIIAIVVSIIGIIFFALGAFGGGYTAATNNEAKGVGDFIMYFSLFMIAACVVSLIAGICSVRAANNSKHIMPAFIFILISLICSVINVVYTFATKDQSGSSVVTPIISLAINAIEFVAANTIRKSR